MMWNEVVNNLSHYSSAVITGLDASGYPFSVRCVPEIDTARQVLRVMFPPDAAIQPGPAGLLCHTHDELLWNLRSFIVHGTLEKVAGEWIFRPIQFTPGGGTGGPFDQLKTMLRWRRTANQYLKKRGLPRPEVHWEKIKALREESKRARSKES